MSAQRTRDDTALNNNMSDKRKEGRVVGPSAGPANAAAAAAAAAPPMSSNMQAVLRLMAGKEERTIAEKFADSNRPTWEQYKKDNKDKLNLEGMDQQEMEAYRRELDEQRERMLARGKNRKKKSSSDSDSEDSRRNKKKRKSKKKKRKRDSSDDSSSDDEKERSKKRKKKRKSKKKKRKGDDDASSEGSHGEHYRLSNFFNSDD